MRKLQLLQQEGATRWSPLLAFSVPEHWEHRLLRFPSFQLRGTRSYVPLR